MICLAELWLSSEPEYKQRGMCNDKPFWFCGFVICGDDALRLPFSKPPKGYVVRVVSVSNCVKTAREVARRRRRGHR